MVKEENKINNEIKNLVNNLKTAIEKDQIKTLTSFRYSYFKFKFRVQDDDLHKFIKFLEPYGERSEYPMPEHIANFFLDNDIKFKMSYRPILKLSLKNNWIMFKYMLNLKSQKLKIDLTNFQNKFKFEFNKKEIAGKLRRNISCVFTSLNDERMIRYFIQGDSHFVKPKILTRKDESTIGKSYMCGFFQIGYMKRKIPK